MGEGSPRTLGNSCVGRPARRPGPGSGQARRSRV